MNTSKPISSRVQSKLLYKTPDDQPYDVAVLRMDPRNLDPSLKPVKLSHAPILKGKYFYCFIYIYEIYFLYHLYTHTHRNILLSLIDVLFLIMHCLLKYYVCNNKIIISLNYIV